MSFHQGVKRRHARERFIASTVADRRAASPARQARVLDGERLLARGGLLGRARGLGRGDELGLAGGGRREGRPIRLDPRAGVREDLPERVGLGAGRRGGVAEGVGVALEAVDEGHLRRDRPPGRVLLEEAAAGRLRVAECHGWAAVMFDASFRQPVDRRHGRQVVEPRPRGEADQEVPVLELVERLVEPADLFRERAPVREADEGDVVLVQETRGVERPAVDRDLAPVR